MSTVPRFADDVIFVHYTKNVLRFDGCVETRRTAVGLYTWHVCDRHTRGVKIWW